MALQKPRGTLDWYGEQLDKFNRVGEILRSLANFYRFNEIVTPTFENLELFNKSVGETSDIVSKELYNFQDKGGRNIALRPEGTAGVVRSYVEEKMYANKIGPTKLFYLINLFRYERPQGGRLREFHQFGVEYLNVDNPLNDVECIFFATNILNAFGLQNSVKLKINNLGSLEQRKLWIEELKKYFEPYKNQLTEDSIKRLDKNPLRILDDKVDGEKDFVKNAPKLSNFLSEEDKEYFEFITQSLEALKVDFEIDESLVRGLDYYTGIVFEFVSTDENLVGKSTIIGGGRYANLIKQTGGPDYQGLGFAIGIERLIIALESIGYDFEIDNSVDVFIGCKDEAISLIGLGLAGLLRNTGLTTDIEYGVFKKDKNAKLAIRNQAKFYIWIDEESVEKNQISIEDMSTNTKEYVKFDDVPNYIFEKLASRN